MENNEAVETVWVKASYGDAPPGTLVGGQDCTGEPIYVTRAEYREDLIPGKLIASHGCTFLTWKGEEVKRYEYEVLVRSKNFWVPASGSKIPTKTYAGGYTKSGEILYVTRTASRPGKCNYLKVFVTSPLMVTNFHFPITKSLLISYF